MNSHHAQPFYADSQSHHKKGSSNVWIVVLSSVFLLFLVLSKFQDIKEFFGISQGTGLVDQLKIGQELSLEGELSQNGDFITHTHTLTTESNGIFGLKSKTMNLNLYSGTIVVEGLLDNEYKGMYILEVKNVIQISSGELVESITGTSAGVYLEKVGLYFAPEFFVDYVLLNSGENGQVKIQKLQDQKNYVIDWFTCKSSVADENCSQLQKNFAGISEKTFTTSADTSFYKLEGVDSWFVSNENLFGYFFNNIPEADVVALSQVVSLPNKNYISTYIVPNISTLCKEGNMVLNTLSNQQFFLEQGVLHLRVAGSGNAMDISCLLKLDPSSSLYAQKVSFESKDIVPIEVVTGTTQDPLVKEDDVKEEDDTSSTQTSQPLVAQGDQFPITLDKTLTFTSSRGHSIIFPSKKIAYESMSVSNNLGIKGVRCYVQTNIIAYTNKDLIKEQATAKVYECTFSGSPELPNIYRSLTLDDGRTFVVEALDPAWVDFANNIQVTLN